MTVLMFGWEFPPHISGGLGTACYGLTKSLGSENTNILFVVPKAHGDESIPMINASEVVLNGEGNNEYVRENLSGSSKDLLKIEVSSKIIPYQNDGAVG